MKKTRTEKKLVLAKETVRNLETGITSMVVGGSVYVCPPPTWYNSCGMFCQEEPFTI